MLLALTVSISSSKDKETIFGTIFFIIWIGGFIVTINAQLLGGKNVNIMQSICVLGYCVFPVNLAAIIIAITKAFLPFFVRALIVIFGFLWATASSINFMKSLVDEKKKILAVYPVFLFYLFLSWFVLVV